MLRESARLAARHGAYWQTHLSEDHGEIGEVARLFPDARDYLDVYDRAGALGARTILAHADPPVPATRSGASSRATRAWRTARHRTCSCPAA